MENRNKDQIAAALDEIISEMSEARKGGLPSATQVNGWMGRMSALYRSLSEVEMDDLMS
mgnify:CR=1 FL=1